MLGHISRTVRCATTSYPFATITRLAYRAAEHGMGVICRAANIFQSYNFAQIAARIADRGLSPVRKVTGLLRYYGLMSLAYKIAGQAAYLLLDYTLWKNFRLLATFGITVGFLLSDSVRYAADKTTKAFNSVKSVFEYFGILGSAGFYTINILTAAYLLPYTIIAVLCSRLMLRGASIKEYTTHRLSYSG